VRNTKVQGWSVKVSVERRVERDASPGAEPLRVIKFVAKSPKAVTVFSKIHAEHTKDARFDGKCTKCSKANRTGRHQDEASGAEIG